MGGVRWSDADDETLHAAMETTGMDGLRYGASVAAVCLLGALLSGPITACDPPTLPPTGRTYVLAFEPDTAGAPTAWRAEHRRALAALTTILAPTGDTWTFGESVSADLTLRTFDSGAGCPHGGGFYSPGESRVFVDYACAHDDAQLQTIVTHEVLHWLEYQRHGTVHHLCRAQGDAPDCYPGITGEGVLNPWLRSELDPDGEPVGPTAPVLTAGDLRVIGFR